MAGTARRGRDAQTQATTPLCSPSRYGFATGRLASRDASKTAQALGGRPRTAAPAATSVLTDENVARILVRQGYHAGWVGKFDLESKADFPEFYEGPDGFSQAPKPTKETLRHDKKVLKRYLARLGFADARRVYRGGVAAAERVHNPE